MKIKKIQSKMRTQTASGINHQVCQILSTLLKKTKPTNQEKKKKQQPNPTKPEKSILLS